MFRPLKVMGFLGLFRIHHPTNCLLFTWLCMGDGGLKPWKQWPEITPILSPANRQIIFAVTSSFLERHCDGTQLSAYRKPHKDDGYASWQDLSWIFWEYLPQMNANGWRFIWHISIWRCESVQSLPILAQQAPHWCPCSHLPRQPLHRGGGLGWQCFGFILGTQPLFIPAHFR